MAATSGFDVARITFNPADRIFCRKDAIAYRGDIGNWERDFQDILATSSPDIVLMFGSSRPGHVIARRICEIRGIPVLSLEEGYIRPGFITAEWGGNNADSPLAGTAFPPAASPPQLQGRDFNGLRPMLRHGALHYAVRSLLSRRSERNFFHREIHPGQELMAGSAMVGSRSRSPAMIARVAMI